MVTALFIARLQPLHLGHLYAIKKALEKFDELIIALGDINITGTFDNPFSFKERKEMLRKSGIKCKIIGIPFVNSDEKWVKITMDSAKFDVIITGNSWVRNCFKGVKSVKVISPEFLKPEKYNATKIREMMIRNEKWWELVPKGTLEVIESVNGVERLKKLIKNKKRKLSFELYLI